MKPIRMTLKVSDDGTLIIPVGVEYAGLEVDVTISPIRVAMTQQEWEALIRRTAGSFEDLGVARPQQSSLDHDGI